MTDIEFPVTGSAEVHVLHEGYVGLAASVPPFRHRAIA